jgi:hypothetical protein
MADALEEFKVSNDILDDPAQLRRRLDEQGYLFIRGLQDPDLLAALRLDILRVCHDGGWIQAGTDLEDGVAATSKRCTEGNTEYTDVYHEVYKLESFHRAGHVPVLLDWEAIYRDWTCTDQQFTGATWIYRSCPRTKPGPAPAFGRRWSGAGRATGMPCSTCTESSNATPPQIRPKPP